MTAGAASSPPRTLSNGVRRPVTAAALVIGLLLVWRILANGVTAIDRASSGAPPQSAADMVAATVEWKEKLARNPADYLSVMNVGLLSERAGDRNRALEAVRAALWLAPNDPVILKQAAAMLLRAGNDAEALLIMRKLVDLHGDGGFAYAVFTKALDSGQHALFFETVARENPPWWPSFFATACPTAALAGLEMVFAIRVAAGKITADERRCLIGRLQREGKWVAAYQLWLNSLPSDQQQRVGLIFNGDFEWPLSNVGFDWDVTGQDGVAVTTETTDGNNGRHALHVMFVNKRFSGSPVQQYLLLSPGRYRFEGRGRAEGLNSWLGLQWGLYCYERGGKEPRQLAVSDSFLGSSDWTDFVQDFVVTRDCPVQILRLELANPRRDAKTGGNVAIRLRGGLWFDELKVKMLQNS